MKYIKFIYLLFIPLFIVSCLPSDDIDDGTEEDIAAKYIGTWHVYEADKKLNYDVVIERYMNSQTEIVLKNFADIGDAKGLCSGNIITVEEQKLDDTYSVEGSGHYENENKVTFSYSLSDGIDIEDHTATFTR